MEDSSSPGVRAGVLMAEYESPSEDDPVRELDRDCGRERRDGE